MLLVLKDWILKWTEPMPLSCATAKSLKKALRERIIASYWVPEVVIADNGVQFTSRVFRRFLTDMGIRQQFTEP